MAPAPPTGLGAYAPYPQSQQLANFDLNKDGDQPGDQAFQARKAGAGKYR